MGVGSGARVLVIGSGGNGLSFAAHALGLAAERVIVVGSRGVEGLSSRVGATDFSEYRAADLDERPKAAVGRSVDFAIDAVGKRSSADVALLLLREGGGALGICGIDDYGSITLNVSRAAGPFRFCGGAYDEAENYQEVTDSYLQGKLDATLWLGSGEPFALGDIGRAFESVRARQTSKAPVRLRG